MRSIHSSRLHLLVTSGTGGGIDADPVFDQLLIPEKVNENGEVVEPARLEPNKDIVLQPGYQEIIEAGDVQLPH